jgi:ClpP class serine protease
VGSIGVVAIHEDFSQAEDDAGVDVTLISAGKYKTDGNEHEPLSNTARAALQDRVSSYHRMFVRAVARHRRASFADVYDGFGEGRTVGASDALKMGMVDRIETMDELLARISSTREGR